MLDNLSLMGPDEDELSLSAVVSSATLLPACAYSAYSIIVNIMPVMGKRAALFYLTRVHRDRLDPHRHIHFLPHGS